MRFAAFSPWGSWLEVVAPNYQTLRLPLPQVLGRHVVLGETHLQTVALIKGKSPEDAFRDTAGSYSKGTGFGGSTFRIEPDGRFCWSTWGCHGTYQQEYGYIKQNHESFELEPIRHPGEAPHPRMKVRFCAVKWGDGTYLVEADDDTLLALARASLGPRDVRYFGQLAYCREFIRDEPPPGLPRLPARVWLKFALEEMTGRIKQNRVKLVLESLIGKRAEPGVPSTAY